MSSVTDFDLPPMTPEEEAEGDRAMLESAISARVRTEAKTPAGRRVVWLYAAPEWRQGAWYALGAMADAAAAARGREARTTRHVFAFALSSGGDLAVTAYRQPFELTSGSGSWLSVCKFEIVAATPSGICRGTLHTTGTEMCCEYLLLPAATPDALAREIADTLYRIDGIEELLALRKPGNRCVVCWRPLKDQISRVLEIGPDCAGRLDIPHNAETVARVLAIRVKGRT